MPNTPSAIKRLKQSAKRRMHNRIAKKIIKTYMKPLFEELLKLVREGIASGVFRPVDPMQFIPSMAAVVVHYFGSAPFMKLMMQEDPLSPERIAARRAAVLDFISAALFQPTALPVEGEHK